MRAVLSLLAIAVVASASINKAGLLCSFCESFIGGIETGLINEEPDMIAYANHLCDDLTNNNQFLDPICQGLLDKELDSILNWLNDNEKPHDICIKSDDSNCISTREEMMVIFLCHTTAIFKDMFTMIMTQTYLRYFEELQITFEESESIKESNEMLLLAENMFSRTKGELKVGSKSFWSNAVLNGTPILNTLR